MKTKQKVIYSPPPNYEDILVRFPVVGRKSGLIFSWGDVIYNPHRVTIDDSLYAHESVHGSRQRSHPQGRDVTGKVIPGVEMWWRDYLAMPEFRMREELPAHVAEYVHRIRKDDSRRNRRRALSQIASRLASPMYGSLIKTKDAKATIQMTAEIAMRGDSDLNIEDLMRQSDKMTYAAGAQA